MSDEAQSELTITTKRGEVITYRRGEEDYYTARQAGMPDVWGLSRVASRALDALVEARAALASDEDRQLLRDIAASGVEFDDPRFDYVVVQVDRPTWDAVIRRAALGTTGGGVEL